MSLVMNTNRGNKQTISNQIQLKEDKRRLDNARKVIIQTSR